MLFHIIKNSLIQTSRNLVIKNSKLRTPANCDNFSQSNNLLLYFAKPTLNQKQFSQTTTNLNKFKMASKPKVVFVLGGPGAGKGTQCQKIVDEFGFVHLSAGDLLREERAREGSEFGEMIEDCIKNGKIVPVDVTCSLIDNAMQKNVKENGKFNFLIDGFPRNQDNLDGWNKKMAEKINFLFVLFFNCDQQVCVDRCLERGKAGSGRSDDNEDSMRKRIATYTNDTIPIIEHYQKLHKVREIDAAPGPDTVFEAVKKVFKQDLDAPKL